MELTRAKEIADSILEVLSPHCEKCEIAGSIRREKEFVKDIEIVCIPKKKGDSKIRINPWIMATYNLGDVVKGKLKNGKYIQINHPKGIKIDLFVTVPEIWGTIFLIRTGPAEYSRHILTEFNKRGYKSEKGVLVNGDDQLMFKEESDLYNFLGQEFQEPVKRGK